MFSQNYMQLPNNFYRDVLPEKMEDAVLLVENKPLMSNLSLAASSEMLLGWLSGDKQAKGMRSIAQKYTGHQFGYYNPDLGDGRGLLLGQWRDADDKAWDFHLKGAGRTPYSRRGDGRAVLRSTIREFLASEALFGLGVPTTRALGIAASKTDLVAREIWEPRASLIRVASSHVRFGHFEWAASQGKETFDALLDYVVSQHFPELIDEERKAQKLFELICVNTANMIAKWQSVGFNHGVMNSDNMSILGETFDFGPYGFFDDFQIGFVCNQSDTEARYAYNEQPKVGLWNCQVLAGAFSVVLEESLLQEGLDLYITTFNQAYLKNMSAKLGLFTCDESDRQMIADLLVLMDADSVDFAAFFRKLALFNSDDEGDLFDLLPSTKRFKPWFDQFEKRLLKENVAFLDWQSRMYQVNPSIVLRNYIAQEIIEDAEKTLSGEGEDLLQKWLSVLHSPFETHLDLMDYQRPPKQNQKGFGLSCSS